MAIAIHLVTGFSFGSMYVSVADGDVMHGRGSKGRLCDRCLITTLDDATEVLFMIMLVTHQEELRNQLIHSLLEKGHEVAVPPHREDVINVLNDFKPVLVILDLYVSDPSGSDNLRLIQEHGYTGAMMVLSGPSMMPVVKEIYSSGGSLKRVIQGPVAVNGRYDLGNLESTIQTLLEEVRHRKRCHASIAQRAYAIYESRGKMEGHNVEDWLRAEQELASGG